MRDIIKVLKDVYLNGKELEDAWEEEIVDYIYYEVYETDNEINEELKEILRKRRKEMLGE